MGYWIVVVTLRDGRRFGNVFLSDSLWGLRFGFPDKTPFRLRDIADVVWEGHRGSRSSAEPTLLRDP